MKRLLLIACLVLLSVSALRAQTFAIKTDLVKWATASVNLEPEFRIGNKSTIAVAISYNPWSFKENKKWKHILVQPEYRYWTCRPFSGHFVSIHPTYAHFNVGNVKSGFLFWDGVKEQRYQGNLYGAGVGYGYHWMLNHRWSIEAQLGLGVGYTKSNRYACETCGDYLGKRKKWHFMPTKVAVQLVYILK